ncbi:MULTISPECIES: glutamate racemase [Cobetia]|uniref:Glutamate racemase n=1 Tax=Cobetia crustatorum TaxID=553385 RepID=A0A558HFK3_9GAMM|nr:MULTISPECIES: glutamate racemase [Cobetia]TVU67838.1 glutamate racemase [Cobetia crustatorum]
MAFSTAHIAHAVTLSEGGDGQPEAPVLVFDSGVGGLSVAAEIRRHWPALSLAYVCDNAALPYGTKADDWLVTRITEVCVAAVKASGARALVVACNTASTLALTSLRKVLKIPVIGTVPAIKPAAALARVRQSDIRRQQGAPPVFALLATSATVRRSYTEQLIHDFASDCRVIRVAADPLVAEAERRLRGEVSRPQVVTDSLADLAAVEDLEVVILGCTHFPLLSADISAALTKGAQGVQGDQVRVALIDSGAAIARRVAEVLALKVLAADTHEQTATGIALATDTGQAGLSIALASQGFAPARALILENAV